MKVIIINGSPRRKGITAAILHEIERGLSVKGIEVMFYDLDAIKMAHCLGCCSCFQSGHCCIKDDAEKLSELITEADGVILGSPTYASNVSGLMKDFIDRGHFVIEQLLHGKYCITVSTGENYGNRDTSKVLGRLVVYSGGLISDSIVVKAPFEAAVLRNTQKQNGSDKEERKSICSKAASSTQSAAWATSWRPTPPSESCNNAGNNCSTERWTTSCDDSKRWVSHPRSCASTTPNSANNDFSRKK